MPLSVGIQLLAGYLILEPLYSIPAIPLPISSVLLLSVGLAFAYDMRKRRKNKELNNAEKMELLQQFFRHPIIVISLCMSINVLLGVLLSAYILEDIFPFNVIFDGLKGLIIGVSIVLIYRNWGSKVRDE